MEHRCHPRRQIVRNALLYHPQGYSYPCRIENASSSGLFIMTNNARIYKGNCVDLLIDSSPYGAKSITTKALVVYKKHDGIGLLCESIISLHELCGPPLQANQNALGMMARLILLANTRRLWLRKYFQEKAL